MRCFDKMFIIFVLLFSSSLFAQDKNEDLDARIKKLEKEIQELKADETCDSCSGDKYIGPTSGYDRGFFIRSDDGNNLFKIKFASNIYYEYDGIIGSKDNNTFGIRNARLILSGHVFDPKLTYRIEPEMTALYTTTTRTTSTTYTVVDSGGDISRFTITDRDIDNDTKNFRLLQLYGQYSFSNYFKLRFGEFKPPMTRTFTTSFYYQQFSGYPEVAVSEPFYPGYHTGLMALGNLHNDKFHYFVFGVNGSGLDRVNINKSMRLGTRLEYDILGENVKLENTDYEYSLNPILSVGGHFSYERADANSAGSYNYGDDIIRTSADSIFKYKGLYLLPEFYYFRNIDQKMNHYGFSAQAGYFLIPKKMDIGIGFSGIWFDGPQNDQYETTIGTNYYFFGHPVKLMFDYSYLYTKQPAQDLQEHRLRLNMQIGFF